MQRRSFLSGMAVSVGTLSQPAPLRSASLNTPLAVRILATMDHPRSMLTVGVAATRELKEGAPWTEAMTPLGVGLSELNGLENASLLRLVTSRIDEDFAAGRVAVIDGWVLAEAEARLAAFVATAVLGIVA